MDDMVHCAVCMDDCSGEYYKYPYTMLLSLFANTKSKVHVHLVTGRELKPEARRHFTELAEKYRQRFSVHLFHSLPEAVRDQIPEKFGYASLYRLYLHELLPVDTVVYLDCDIIVNLDIAELYRLFDENVMIAGVKEEETWRDVKGADKEYLRHFGIDAGRYLNSGVLLLHLRAIRELCADGNVFEARLLEMCRHAAAGGRKLRFPDQDALNSVCAERKLNVAYLDDKFNYYFNDYGRLLETLHDLQGKIIHFTKVKPFKEFFPAALIFWQYYAHTPWKNEAVDTLGALPCIREWELMRFISTTPKIKKVYMKFYKYRSMGLKAFLKSRLGFKV